MSSGPWSSRLDVLDRLVPLALAREMPDFFVMVRASRLWSLWRVKCRCAKISAYPLSAATRAAAPAASATVPGNRTPQIHTVLASIVARSRLSRAAPSTKAPKRSSDELVNHALSRQVRSGLRLRGLSGFSTYRAAAGKSARQRLRQSEKGERRHHRLPQGRPPVRQHRHG